jgi:hypothetical protein
LRAYIAQAEDVREDIAEEMRQSGRRSQEEK